MVGYRPDGKPDIREVTAKAQKACKERFDALKAQAASGTLPDASKGRETVAAFLTSWLDSIDGTMEPGPSSATETTFDGTSRRVSAGTSWPIFVPSISSRCSPRCAQSGRRPRCRSMPRPVVGVRARIVRPPCRRSRLGVSSTSTRRSGRHWRRLWSGEHPQECRNCAQGPQGTVSRDPIPVSGGSGDVPGRCHRCGGPACPAVRGRRPVRLPSRRAARLEVVGCHGGRGHQHQSDADQDEGRRTCFL